MSAQLLQGFLADTMQQPPKTCCCLISSCHSSLFRHYKDLLAGDSSPEICFLRILARQSSPNSPSQTLPSTHAQLDIHITVWCRSFCFDPQVYHQWSHTFRLPCNRMFDISNKLWVKLLVNISLSFSCFYQSLSLELTGISQRLNAIAFLE